MFVRILITDLCLYSLTILIMLALESEFGRMPSFPLHILLKSLSYCFFKCLMDFNNEGFSMMGTLLLIQSHCSLVCFGFSFNLRNCVHFYQLCISAHNYLCISTMSDAASLFPEYCCPFLTPILVLFPFLLKIGFYLFKFFPPFTDLEVGLLPFNSFKHNNDLFSSCSYWSQ